MDYRNLLTSHCVASLINKPTRLTATTATSLDHILTNENRYVFTTAVIECNINYLSDNGFHFLQTNSQLYTIKICQITKETWY